jgi:hypothetical protein
MATTQAKTAVKPVSNKKIPTVKAVPFSKTSPLKYFTVYLIVKLKKLSSQRVVLGV